MRSPVPFLRHARSVALPLGGILLAALCSACGGKSEPQPSARAVVTRAATATQAQKHLHFVFDDVSGTFQGIPLHSELIVAGGKYYLKDPFTGKWRPVSVSANPVAFFDPAKGVLAVIRQATQLELVGSEKVGGADAYHLKGKTTVGSITPLLGNPPGTRPVDVELWVDKGTGRLVRLRLTGEVESGDPADAVRTIEISRYGTVVPIAPPRTGS